MRLKQLETFIYKESQWSVSEFPKLDSDRTLVLVFGAPEYIDNPHPIEDLARAYPNSAVVGCSTSGEIYDEMILDESLTVSVMKLEHTHIVRADGAVSSAADSYDAGQAIARALVGPNLRGVLVLSEGININGSELVRGLNAVLPETVVVTGGLAGDGDRFKKTWIIRDGTPQR